MAPVAVASCEPAAERHGDLAARLPATSQDAAARMSGMPTLPRLAGTATWLIAVVVAVLARHGGRPVRVHQLHPGGPARPPVPRRRRPPRRPPRRRRPSTGADGRPTADRRHVDRAARATASPATGSRRCCSARTPRRSAARRDVTGTLDDRGHDGHRGRRQVDMTTVESDESPARRPVPGPHHGDGRVPDRHVHAHRADRPRARSRPTARRSRSRPPASSRCTASPRRSPSSSTATPHGGTIVVNGAIPIDFDDYEIPDASGGPASVGRDGELELLLVFAR